MPNKLIKRKHNVPAMQNINVPNSSLAVAVGGCVFVQKCVFGFQTVVKEFVK